MQDPLPMADGFLTPHLPTSPAHVPLPEPLGPGTALGTPEGGSPVTCVCPL